MTPEISVVVPTGGRPGRLLQCLDALSRQKLPHHQFEIIVVDDANDRTTEATVRNFTHVFGIEARYLSQPKHLGLANARNRGWQAARGQIIAFTDDDCQPQPDWLLSAYPCFKRGAQVVSGQLRIPLMGRLSPYEHAPLFTESADFTAANFFCLRSALRRVGGFTEDYSYSWHEDSDMNFKLIQKGIPVSKCPEAVVLHPLESSKESLLAEERRKSHNALLYKRHPDLYRKRIPLDRALMLQYIGVILSVTAMLAALLTGKFALVLLAFGLWLFLTVDLFWKWLPGGEGTLETVRQTATTAILMPFWAIYWRLYGSVKYRVFYL
jgi:GT2 family glycosyltransferase